MPYRIEIVHPPSDALDVLMDLGALDIETVDEGAAAILPDSVTHERLAEAFGGASVTVSEAVARDSGSVWVLSQRAVRIGPMLIGCPDMAAGPNTLRLTDSPAFGSGHHPTTALCIEVLAEILTTEELDSMLDVGTGSGILALAALMLGVRQAVGLDIDADALKIAAENARLNELAERFRLILGGANEVAGTWPLVVANVLAAPLIEMAPVLVRRVGKGGRLVLSGIPEGLELEVRQAYQHFGMRHLYSESRAGWTVVVFQSSW